MKKKELLKLTSKKYNEQNRWGYSTPGTMEIMLSSLVDALIDALVKDGKVTIRGLATLEVVDYGDSERGAWNPFTKEPMEYKPKKKIRCRFSKRIRDAINA